MNYNLIQDEDELNRFISNILPEITTDECFLLFLGARRKYLTEEEKETYRLGESFFRREIVSHAEKLPRKIRELCVERGLYTDKNKIPIPDHAFTVYITPNPRSHRKAAMETIKVASEKLYRGEPILLDRLAKTELHKAYSRKIFLDLDVDPSGKDDLPTILDQIKDCLGDSTFFTIKTANGAHVLVKTENIDRNVRKTFHRQLQQLSADMDGEIEFRNDALLPVPGTTQGGTVPRTLDS